MRIARCVSASASVAERGLAEARRFVHDLAPADLAETGDLPSALRALTARETTDDRTVTCHVDGVAGPLPERVQSALLRIAQGALANVREHSGATRAAVTLTYLGDEVRLDVADDGHGFDPAAPGPGGDRGHDRLSDQQLQRGRVAHPAQPGGREVEPARALRQP